MQDNEQIIEPKDINNFLAFKGYDLEKNLKELKKIYNTINNGIILNDIDTYKVIDAKLSPNEFIKNLEYIQDTLNKICIASNSYKELISIELDKAQKQLK